MADAAQRFARSKPPGCAGCPAEQQGRGYVPGTGPSSPRYLLLGQGPGEHEAITGQPFVGPSGRVLDRWLAQAGIDRRLAWVDNVVRCWLPDNREPTAAEVRHCTTQHVWPALRALSPEPRAVLVAIGAPATAVTLGKGIPHGTFHQWATPTPTEEPK